TVDASAAMLGSVRIDHRSEERMGETDAPGCELEAPCVACRRDRVLPVLDGGGHHRCLRPPECGNDEQCCACLVRKGGHPPRDDVSKRLGDGESVPTFGGFGGGPGELEREEWVAA